MSAGPASWWQLYDGAGRRKYLTGDERARFLCAADRRDPRTRALCHLLAHTGCRLSEALRLRRHQLDAERHLVVMFTLKRRRAVYRVIPVPERLAAMLAALPCPAGAPDHFWTWHRATAWRRVKQVMRLAGIDPLTPQSCPRGLRHGFGMHAAAHAVPGSLIQRWLGHASPNTTAIYLDAHGPEERAFAARMWT